MEGFELLEEMDEEGFEKRQIVIQGLISRDAKAWGLVQGAVSDEIFLRVASQDTANEAWDVLK